MELLQALRTRRAIRHFTPEMIGRSQIEELIGAAVMAPSAMNLQPWAFAVIHGAESLRELSAEAREYALAHLAPDSPLARHLADTSVEIFHGAVVLIVVCATDGGSQSAEDCCLAGENLWLAAHGQGLGACWIGLSRPWLNEPAVKARLGIPADLHPVAPIVLGHHRTAPEATTRKTPRVVWCH